MALTKVKAGNIILTTPAASSNDVTPATTQYVTTALANLADSAPSTLNTLNELAAALGDDANFSTTVTNSIAAKAPLASPTFTGTITGPHIISTSNTATQFKNATDTDVQHKLETNAGSDFAIHRLIGSDGVDNKFIIGYGPNHGSTPNQVALKATHSSGTIGLYTGASSIERMHITSAGKVGIGIDNPATQLQLLKTGESMIRMGYSTTQYGQVGRNSDGTYELSCYENGAVLKFGTSTTNNATTERMRITSGGNVNIGYGVSNTQSTWPLHLAYSNNNGAHGGIQVKNTNTGSTSNFAGMSAHAVNGGVQAFYYAADYDTWGVGAFAGSASNHPFHLMTNNTERMRIDSTGAVLVGSPTNLNVLSGTPMLQIGAGTGHSSLQFYSGTGSVGALYFGDATAGNDRYDGYLEYRHNSRDMAFRAGGATVLTLRGNNANGTGHNVDYGEHQHDVGEGVGVGEFYTQVAGSSFTDQFRINFDNASWGGVTVDIRLNPNSSAGASVWVQYTIYSHAAHASANISAKDISGEGTGYINWVQESAGNLKCQLKTQYVTDDASARITYQMNHRGSQSIYLEEI